MSPIKGFQQSAHGEIASEGTAATLCIAGKEVQPSYCAVFASGLSAAGQNGVFNPVDTLLKTHGAAFTKVAAGGIENPEVKPGEIPYKPKDMFGAAPAPAK